MAGAGFVAESQPVLARVLPRVFLLLPLLLLPRALAADPPPQDAFARCCSGGGPPVRNLSAMQPRDYGLPGLTHLTVAGKLHHGTKEVEVWLQTLAPGAGTPIHRHDNEEVFMILRGSGVLLRATSGPHTGAKAPGSFPGEPSSVTFGANSTFFLPANEVHQIVNTPNSTEDLQLYAVISRPPMHVFVYPTWTHPHDEAVSIFPIFWDKDI